MSELTVGSLSGLAANSYVIDVASGSSLDLTNGATLPAGSVLQVVSTTKTDTFTTTSTSFTDITSLSVSITPTSASSKILVMGTLSMRGIEGSNNAFARLLRDSTPIFLGDAAGSRLQGFVVDSGGAGNNAPNHSFNFLDSPASTSATVYKIQMRVTGSTGYVNRSSADTDDGSNGMRTASTITVMEVAG